ncbi:hypothetical protein B0T10DRAFT_4198 [Thelonectria olida]|uniref:Uncharacterized protein n=1 Tax=Thelonectria olida TaxID=1576542 RepID=A0A9P8WHT7_9HYPO|nr:hypothetical protein B0T10DRAFT_4198 [Thelonectria olida]
MPRPSRVGSDFSWIQFPEDMKAYMYHDIVRFITVVKDALYSSKICLRCDLESTDWVGILMGDVVYVHSMLFSVETYLNESIGWERSALTQFHFVKTLGLLLERVVVPGDPLASRTKPS